jgi:hypothetical protein
MYCLAPISKPYFPSTQFKTKGCICTGHEGVRESGGDSRPPHYVEVSVISFIPLNRRPGGAHSRSGLFGEEIKLPVLQGTKSRFLTFQAVS